MLFETSLLFATNAIALFVAFVVLLSATIGWRLRASVCMTVLSLLFWQDAIYVADNSTLNLELWNNLAFAGPTLALIGFYLFIHFLHASTIRERSSVLIQSLPIAFCVAVVLQMKAIVSMSIFAAITTDAYGGRHFVRSDGYYLYLIAFMFALIFVIVRLIMSLRLSQPASQERYALKSVLLTAIVSSLYGVIMNIIVPIATGSQSYISLGMITVDLFAAGFAFSVFRGRLLDVRLYVVRTVGYVLSLLALSVLYIALAFFASQTFLKYSYSSSQTIINVVFVLVLSFLFQPMRLFFDRVTRKLFYRDTYDTDEFFAHFNRILTATTDLEKLLEESAYEISNTLHTEQAFFYIYHSEGRDIIVGAKHHDRSQRQRLADAEAELKVAATSSKLILTELLARENTLRKILSKQRIALVLPLFSNQTVIGYLFLGDQRSRQYTSRDMKILSTLADELAIAVQNSLSVQEIKELNETLQQRIHEATKELRTSNEQLKRLDAAKDEFVSMASHQLRTPLTSVKGYISMVLEGDVGDVTPMQRKLLEEAFASSERMVHLISDFLNVSRLQTGKFVVEATAVDMAKIVKQEVEGLVSTAEAHSLKLRFHKPSYFPTLYLDEGKIRQVVMNFIDNAIFYSREHSVIDIGLVIEDGQAVFTVHDSGIGVPKDQQTHLFTKFFRADNARRQRPDGTGVGLFLAKKVIVAHGGSIVFESVEGEGSTFGFRLPIKKLAEVPTKLGQAGELKSKTPA